MPMIEETLKKYIATIPEGNLKHAISYALLGNGKRVRPMLSMTLLESLGINPQPYLNALVAVELIHTYSLIHDDLPSMDNDTMRRGKPTVHIAFDEGTAILAGDALLTDSFYLVTETKALTGDEKSQIISILAKKAGSLGMVLGQIKDIESEKKQITIDDLNQMYELKTANLIQASLMTAAVIGAKKDISLYESLGYYIGLIFQIQDDILEYTLTPDETGKSKSDELREKPTYVSLLGLDKSRFILNQYTQKLNHLIQTLGLENTSIHDQIKQLLTRKK